MTRLIIILLTILLLLLPIVPTQYKVLVEQPTIEEFTTSEPYIVYEEVQVPYRTMESYTYWQESKAYTQWKERIKTSIEDSLPSYCGLGKSLSGRWVMENRWVTKYRTVEKPITRYRTVTKTRMVSTLTTEMRSRRISILYYIIGGRQ